MRNFSVPLAITGTKEELESLIPELERLGYKTTNLEPQQWEWLVTDYKEMGLITNTCRPDATKMKSRIEVPASNRDLVLALAAMSEGPEFFEGEWVVALESSCGGGYRKGEFYVTLNGESKILTTKNDSHGVVNGWNNEYFRKVTKEELINKFMETTKKIIGYKIHSCVERGQASYSLADLIPIYEEEKKQVTLSCGLLVVIKDKRAICEQNWFTKEELEQVLATKTIAQCSKDATTFIPETFKVGCKTVTREDIEKVINLLK